jgi:myo-inositol-1(or 4)-monophosphatase
MPIDVTEILNIAKEAARQAGRLQRERFGEPGAVEHKGQEDRELVTEVDVACEELIVKLIRGRFPDHDVLGEEGVVGEPEGDTDGQSPHQWIIDPLDGTTNYAHGFPIYGSSVAYAFEGEVRVAACALPMWDQLYWGVRGRGAFVDNRPVQVSREREFHRALLTTGFPSDQQAGAPDNFGLFTRISQQVQAVRRPGAAVVDLCMVAAGGFDGFWEQRLKPWDTAAGALIVEEAGGRVTTLEGLPWDPEQTSIVASNETIHDELLAALAAARDAETVSVGDTAPVEDPPA